MLFLHVNSFWQSVPPRHCSFSLDSACFYIYYLKNCNSSFKIKQCECLGTIHIWRPLSIGGSWKLSDFQETPHPHVRNSSIPWPWTSNFKQPPPPFFPSPSPNNQSIKRKHNPRWLLYVIRYFLQIGFHFQYQLIINLVWLSIDFSSFSNFKKLRICFWPFSYSEKTRWGQGWAEASLSTFSWLYILVCAVVKKYHEMFS